MKITIDIKYGSESQEKVFKKIIDDQLNALKSVVELRHKKNKFNIQIEED